MHFITETSIIEFEQRLMDNEKSEATVEKYRAALRKLMEWLDGRAVSRSLLMEYRDYFKKNHAVASVNGTISAINSYLDAFGMSDCKLKLMKVQRCVFRSADRDMTKDEYFRLIKTAQKH